MLTGIALLALLAAPQTAPGLQPGGIPVGPPPKPAPIAAPPGPVVERHLGGAHGGGRFSPPNTTNVEVNSSSTDDQCDGTIAVDPTDRLHLVAGGDDSRQAGTWTDAFYSSFDGGLTWSELFFPDPGGYGASAYPRVAFGPNGETYFGALAYTYSSSQARAFFVGRSNDGGLSVPNWVLAVPRTKLAFPELPGMAVDTTFGPRSGAIYVTWSKWASISNVPIMVTASFDGGATWSTPVRLSDHISCNGSAPVVGPNGELDVAFYDYTDASIKFDSSPDGGVTWGTDVKVADVKFVSTLPNAPFYVNSFPSIDVDTSGGPFQGSIYVCWSSDQGGARGTDVMISSSRDGGATWSTPIPASDVTTNAQFLPHVDVDENGNVNVGFYDRRDDPNDVLIRYYVSRSSDGGVSFQPNVAGSDLSYDPNLSSDGYFLGYASGLAASDRSVHPIWTDERNGDNDLYTARMQFDIHTDVSDLSAATGGTVNFTLNPGPLYNNDVYEILGSASGTAPGIDFYFANLPLNFDSFMLSTILLVNTGTFPGFGGTLDATGSATASMLSGPLDPSVVGMQLVFAAFVRVGSSVRWTSNPTQISIVP